MLNADSAALDEMVAPLMTSMSSTASGAAGLPTY